jgi:hypothetical protein
MKARLVAIGDSLTQGFQHGAVRRTEWSYPAMVARVLGGDAFRQADFSGNGDGGPLLDIERLANVIAARAGRHLDPWDVPGAALSILSFMDRIEDYWERGAGAKRSDTGPLHHNVAVWGFEILDAITLTDGACLRNTPRPKDDLFDQVPERAMYRTARRVLNPWQATGRNEDLTQLGVAQAIAAKDGIENLLVALGSNNALATCLRLEMLWSQSADFRKLPHQRNVTIWESRHFIEIFDRLAEQIANVKAERVFLATVPHVTIAPVARGTSPRARRLGTPERDEKGFYEYYTHFWTWDSAFDPDKDDRITREDARTIDGTIDEYNAHIRKRPFPAGLVAALKKNEKTKFRVREGDQVLLDTRYFSLPKNQPAANATFEEWQAAYTGGLFGLDGVHPTTIGYGLVADELLAVMKKAGVPDADPAKLDWDAIVGADTLVTDPPPILGSLRQTLDKLFNVGQLGRVIKKLSGVGSQP